MFSFHFLGSSSPHDPLQTPWPPWAFQMKHTYHSNLASTDVWKHDTCLSRSWWHHSEWLFTAACVFMQVYNFNFPNSWIVFYCVNVPRFVNHSSADRDLGSSVSWLLRTEQQWARMMDKYLCSRIWSSLSLYPGMLQLEYVADLSSAFWGSSPLISTVAVLVVYTPPAMNQCSLFPTNMTSFAFVYFS